MCFKLSIAINRFAGNWEIIFCLRIALSWMRRVCDWHPQFARLKVYWKEKQRKKNTKNNLHAIIVVVRAVLVQSNKKKELVGRPGSRKSRAFVNRFAPPQCTLIGDGSRRPSALAYTTTWLDTRSPAALAPSHVAAFSCSATVILTWRQFFFQHVW